MRNIDVIILGAGPAGLSAGLKLMQLGRRVLVVSIHRPNRPSQLESIPNIDVLRHAFPIDNIQDTGVIDQARTGVSWWLGKEKTTNPVFIVERNLLDPALLTNAQSAGLEVHLTGMDNIKPFFYQGWNLILDGNHFRCPYIIDASGRNSSNGNRKPLLPWKQISITGDAIIDSDAPGLWTESLPEGWLWAIRSCDNRTSVSLFTDPLSVGRDLNKYWSEMISSSRIASLIKTNSPTLAIRDVTPVAAGQVIQDGILLVGDSALARDPLGSQGLSATISEALGAAIGLHNILLDSTKEDLVLRFLRNRHAGACKRHRIFLGESYGDAPYETSFWTSRKSGGDKKTKEESSGLFGPDEVLLKSSEWQMQLCPVLNGDSIDLANCLCSENESIRWLAGITVERLLSYIDTSVTTRLLLDKWQRCEGISEHTALRALRWMTNEQVLIPTNK